MFLNIVGWKLLGYIFVTVAAKLLLAILVCVGITEYFWCVVWHGHMWLINGNLWCELGNPSIYVTACMYFLGGITDSQTCCFICDIRDHTHWEEAEGCWYSIEDHTCCQGKTMVIDVTMIECHCFVFVLGKDYWLLSSRRLQSSFQSGHSTYQTFPQNLRYFRSEFEGFDQF